MKVFLHLLCFVFLLLCSACVTLYVPNAVYSPGLKEKNELNATVTLGASGCGLANLQAAYAATNHFEVMIDGMYHAMNQNAHDPFKSSNVDEKLRVQSAEVGAGYFTPLEKKNRIWFQGLAGAGVGSSRDKVNYNDQPNPEVSSNFTSAFIQPGIFFIWHKSEFAIDLRANYVNVHDIQAYLYEKFEFWNTDFKYYSDATLDFVILEPTFTFKYGTRKLKGIFQTGLTLPTINPRSYFAINTSSILGAPLIKFTFGVSYTFCKKVEGK